MLGEVASYDLLIHNYSIILEREREFMQFTEEILLKLGMETNNTTLVDYVFVPSSAAPTLILYSLVSIQIPFIFYATN